MAIPDFQTIMLPLLKLSADQQEHSLSQVVETLAQEFHLSETERKELLPSGQQTYLANRVGWALTHMKKAGLFEYTGRGRFMLTARGVSALRDNPSKVDMKYLAQFPEYVEFRKKSSIKATQVSKNGDVQSHLTPKEAIEDGYQRLRQDLAQELLGSVKSAPPDFFERLVVDLLLKMGYGGSRKDAGKAVGKSGDGGIDGIINEDRLGLDVIYIQAKRWENVVGSPEIHKFVGALQGKKARRGVFITTSKFTKDARDFVSSIIDRVVLVDGEELAQLMMDYGVGVSIESRYEIKKIDSDYFTTL